MLSLAYIQSELSFILFCSAWTLRPKDYRQLHQPFMKSDSQEQKEAHAQACAYWKRNISHLLFGSVAAESHGNQLKRGEKSARWQAELHRSGSRAQTLKSHDKNNIPHLSDSLQGIRVKQRHFSVCIPHYIKAICRNVWMWILLQLRVRGGKKDTYFWVCSHMELCSALQRSCKSRMFQTIRSRVSVLFNSRFERWSCVFSCICNACSHTVT